MSSLPSYVAEAQAVPAAKRMAWYKNVAPTYAGVMLWFVFWQNIAIGGDAKPLGGGLSQGVVTALLGLLLAAFVCHVLYLVPGLLGMKTGLPLYVVGTSTYGVTGGLLMPGFLMGLLQFGWLGVNAYAVAALLCHCFGIGASGPVWHPSLAHAVIATAFAVMCGFVGLKGIRYVAKVATYLPLIPLAVLIMLVVKTAGGLGTFDPEKTAVLEMAPAATTAATADTGKAPAGETKPQAAPATPLGSWGVFAFFLTYVVGFFATAGAAGTDIASNSRNGSDVQWGGLVGVTLTAIVAGGLAILVVAGAYGADMVPASVAGSLNPLDLMSAVRGKGETISPIMQFKEVANVIMILLAISSFPGGCFSAFIAANSFKTTLPKVPPLLSVGIGTLAAVVLAVTGVADHVGAIFEVIGASFGPVCGAMAADYLLAGRKWAGPRAGFNPAGWISWIVGFAVGAFNMVATLLTPWVPALAHKQDLVPVPPVAAFVAGFVLYFVLAAIGLTSRKLDMPATAS